MTIIQHSNGGAVYQGFTFMNFMCVLVGLHVYIMYIDKKGWCEEIDES